MAARGAGVTINGGRVLRPRETSMLELRGFQNLMSLSVALALTACGSSTAGTASEGSTSGASDATAADATTASSGGAPTTGEATVDPTVDPTSAGATTAGSGTDATSDGTTADATTTTGVTGDCGNDALEPGEECDGADLGGKQCSDVDPAYIGGVLACGDTCTFDASACMVAPDAALVALNEVTSQDVAMGPYAGMGDAIELHNAGKLAADLSGWMLTDDPLFPMGKVYVFPDGTTLAPGAFLVLVTLDPMTMVGDFPFGISNKTVETLILADADSQVVDMVDVDGYKALVSYCRLPDGVGGWEQCVQTFGAVNQLAPTACGNGKREDLEECDGADLAGKTCKDVNPGYTGGTLACTPKCNFDPAGCTTTTQVVLNELESTVDDIEIYNGGNVGVDLSGWILTDDKVDANYDPMVDTAELVFAPGTMLGAKQYRVVHVGMGPGQHPFGLGMNGDRVTLAKADLTIVDQVNYAAGEAVTSYCRLPNGPGGTWTADCAATMGGANK